MTSTGQLMKAANGKLTNKIYIVKVRNTEAHYFVIGLHLHISYFFVH